MRTSGDIQQVLLGVTFEGRACINQDRLCGNFMLLNIIHVNELPQAVDEIKKDVTNYLLLGLKTEKVKIESYKDTISIKFNELIKVKTGKTQVLEVDCIEGKLENEQVGKTVRIWLNCQKFH